MPALLARLFSRELLPDKQVQAFYCGSTDWELTTATWLKTERAAQSIEKYGTEVWLYYEGSAQGKLIGYGAVGKTRRRWPSQDDCYQEISLIPQIAVQQEYWGKPEGCAPNERYSHQIIYDLIAKAKAHETSVLVLDVHVENKRALAFYRKIGFAESDNVIDGHMRLSLRFS